MNKNISDEILFDEVYNLFLIKSWLKSTSWVQGDFTQAYGKKL